jgi:hypothetical protein
MSVDGKGGCGSQAEKLSRVQEASVLEGERIYSSLFGVKKLSIGDFIYSFNVASHGNKFLLIWNDLSVRRGGGELGHQPRLTKPFQLPS